MPSKVGRDGSCFFCPAMALPQQHGTAVIVALPAVVFTRRGSSHRLPVQRKQCPRTTVGLSMPIVCQKKKQCGVRRHESIFCPWGLTRCACLLFLCIRARYVWACLVENVDLAYELLLQPQSSDFQQALYRDWKIWARQFGIPRHLIPPTRDALQCYMEAELAARLPLHEDSVRVMQTMYEIGR